MYNPTVAGTTAVLGTKVLPFTGALFGVYLTLAVGLIVLGVALKVIGRKRATI
jgi:hypothetical protein